MGRAAEGGFSQRGEVGSDQCVIDDKHFFIRGGIEIPLMDMQEDFAWLVWAEVSRTDFLDMSSKWKSEGRVNGPLFWALGKRIAWDTRMLGSSGYRFFSHPEICSGDQSRTSLLATMFRNLRFVANRQRFGRNAEIQA
ncbi:MAG TPA: DUF2199 domain-containing protein [Terriglobales bacterium]|nr:DUF2199 domain-containing protein [Terriglobales bacterium]